MTNRAANKTERNLRRRGLSLSFFPSDVETEREEVEKGGPGFSRAAGIPANPATESDYFIRKLQLALIHFRMRLLEKAKETLRKEGTTGGGRVYLSDLMLPELSVNTAPTDGGLITRYSQVSKYRVSPKRKKKKREGRKKSSPDRWKMF